MNNTPLSHEELQENLTKKIAIKVMNYHEELDGILNETNNQTKIKIMNNNNQEIVEKLEAMRTMMSQTFLEMTLKPKLSSRGYVQEVLKMSMNARDKVVLLDLLVHSDDNELQKGSTCQERCNMTRQEYNNGARSLQKQGYIKQVKRGFYQINPIF